MTAYPVPDYLARRAWRLPAEGEGIGFGRPRRIAECPWLVAVLDYLAPWCLRRILVDGAPAATWPAWLATGGLELVHLGGAAAAAQPPRIEVFALPTALPPTARAWSHHDLEPFWLDRRAPSLGSVRAPAGWDDVSNGEIDLVIVAGDLTPERVACAARGLAPGGVLAVGGVPPTWIGERGFLVLDVPDPRYEQWPTVMHRELARRYALVVEPLHG